jgi:hypothetical protein
VLEGFENKKSLGKRLIIDPNSGWKIKWDLFVGFLIVYGFITLPLVMAFPQSPVCDGVDLNLVRCENVNRQINSF